MTPTLSLNVKCNEPFSNFAFSFNLRRYNTVGRGVTRSKRLAEQCIRKAAENGHSEACLGLAQARGLM